MNLPDITAPLSLMAMTNLALATTGVVSSLVAMRIKTPRSKFFLMMGFLICLSYIGFDLVWLFDGMAEIVGDVNEWIWRLWEAGVALFCTLVAMDYSRCREQDNSCLSQKDCIYGQH